MVIEKHEENIYLKKIEKLFRQYREFWFFLAGLLLGYLLRAIA